MGGCGGRGNLFRSLLLLGDQSRFLNSIILDFWDAEICALVEHFSPVIPNPEIKIGDQWTKLYLEQRSLKTLTGADVGHVRGRTCPGITTLIQIIPATTADYERGFNVMRMVKNRPTDQGLVWTDVPTCRQCFHAMCPIISGLRAIVLNIVSRSQAHLYSAIYCHVLSCCYRDIYSI